MKVASLFSGGKDSTYALYVAQQRGWEVTSLVTVFPSDPDSHLYHTLNLELVPLLAECLSTSLVREVAGAGEDEEVAALGKALAGLEVDGLVMGTIASDYQKSRVDRICHKLGLRTFAPLWRHDQKDLLRDYIASGFHILITGVAAEGLDESWLGREMNDASGTELLALHEKHGLSVCGEGGEFETLVVDGPNFAKRLRIIEARKEFKGTSGVYRVLKAEVQEKGGQGTER